MPTLTTSLAVYKARSFAQTSDICVLSSLRLMHNKDLSTNLIVFGLLVDEKLNHKCRVIKRKKLYHIDLQVYFYFEKICLVDHFFVIRKIG